MKKMRHMVFMTMAVLCGLGLLCVACAKAKKTADKSTIIEEVDFDTSMGKGSKEWQQVFGNTDDVKRYNTLKSFYEKNLPSQVALSETPKIPKIIHQIWLGPKNPPPYFFSFRDKWLKMHPDWTYRLWTDADLDDLNLKLRDILEASPNWAEKSDILRSELLERFGGVYIDVDMDPMKVLTELNYKYDLYAGVEHPHKICTTNNTVWVGISLIASKPHHPIFKRWQELIRARWEKVNESYTSQVERVVNHTYFPFSLAVFEKCHEENLTNMFFPATYFYPLTCEHASKQKAPIRSFREKFYEFLEKIHVKKSQPFSHAFPETIAVHYWGNSWIPSANDQMKELQHQLDIVKRECYLMQKKLYEVEKAQVAMKGQRPQVEASETVSLTVAN